eukprot:m.14893 g.14893  ORF g.14893 m.14893 type:complete len:724 (+) comp26030_c0_seq4:316-2487(+)
MLRVAAVLLHFLLGTVSSTGSTDFLLISERYRLRGLSLSSGSSPDVITPVSGLASGVAVDFSAKTKELLWSDVFAKTISAADYTNSSKRRTILQKLSVPDGIAVDWVGQNVYFTDTGLDVIGVVGLDGNFPRIIIDASLDQPRAIVVDPEDGYMYWTDWGSSPKIERAYMSGKNRKTIVSSGISWPNGLVLDIPNKKLYWAEAKYDRIESCNLDGTSRSLVLSVSGRVFHPFDLALSGSDLFWSDWYGNRLYKASINGAIDTKYKDLNARPYGMVAFKHSRTGGTNSCSKNNGGCDQLCLPEASSSVCACSYGELQSDGKTCKNIEKYLLVADIDSVRGLTTATMAEATKPIQGLTRAIAVDYDPITEDVYYTDVTLGTIEQVTASGVKKTLINSLRVPDGLAVDWISRAIYYTDASWNRIGVVEITGNNHMVLIGSGLDEPRDIALDLKDGMMYWTDWGLAAKIEKAQMDGTGRKAIVSSGLYWPNGLVLDTANKVLYWADARLDKIEKCNFDGTGRKVLLKTYFIHPYGLVLDSGLLYWSDWQGKNVIRLPVNSTGIQNMYIYAAPFPRLSRPSGMVIHDPVSRKQIKNACSLRNGNCSQLCAAVPNGRKCVCNPTNSTVCKPTITIGQSSITVKEFANVVLPCKVGTVQGETDIPLTETRWYKDDEEIPGKTELWSTGSSVRDVSFAIKYPTKGISGKYHCSATNNYGTTKSENIQLTVT